MARMHAHYHVLMGLRGGYLPDVNDVCATRADAIAQALYWVRMNLDEGSRVKGNARDGFWVIADGPSLFDDGWAYNRCIEIVGCDDDCSQEAEY